MVWNFKNHADNTAVITDAGENFTYQQLQVANEKLVSNIKERCLVFSLCTNSLGSIIGYTGFINNNIVTLLLDSHIDYELLKQLIDIYKPSYLWIPKRMSDDFLEFEFVYSDFNYLLLKTDFNLQYPLYIDLALLLPTSGSTGSPKLVRQSYQNINSNMMSICEYLNLDKEEKPITTLPMNYTYGLSIINSHLSVGATILLTDKSLMDKGFWSFFREESATSFGGVPYTYEILDKLRINRMNLPSLRTLTQAGGKLSKDLHKKFAEYANETNKNFIVMYGQTEATARMSYLPKEKTLDKIGSMGIAIPGGKFSLIDMIGNEITEPNVIGELVYEGSNVTLGYSYSGDDLNKGDERFGKLITGDMAMKDNEGFYYIVGRKKRFLKIFGNRVNLDETERIIKAQFNAIDCACTGIDDKMYIFITNESYSEIVRKYISEKSGLNSVAFEIRPIDVIPKNESGKTLYINLEKYYN